MDGSGFFFLGGVEKANGGKCRSFDMHQRRERRAGVDL